MHGAASPREISALGQSWTPHVQIQVRAPRPLPSAVSPPWPLGSSPLCVCVPTPSSLKSD